MSGVHRREVSVRGQALGTAEADTSAGFVELAEDQEFAFMGHAEARKGRCGLFADGPYLKLSPEGQTGPVSLGALSSSGFNIETEIKSSILELGGFYRVGQMGIDRPRCRRPPAFVGGVARGTLHRT